MDLTARRRVILAAQPRLPWGYQEVEWIGYSSGHAYILTDYIPSNGDTIDMTIMFKDRTNPQSIFSAGAGTYQLIALYGRLQNRDVIWWKYFASGAAKYIYPSFNLDSWQNLTVSSTGVLTFGGDSEPSTFQNNLDGAYTEIMFFSRRNAATRTQFTGRMKEIMVTNSGQNKLHLVPCYRKADGEIGMYDLVGGVFYSNFSGAGTFERGNDV